MVMSTINDVFTVKEAAEELGVTAARVRQICIEHDIGKVIGRDRLFTPEDMERLQSVPRKVGRPRTKI